MSASSECSPYTATSSTSSVSLPPLPTAVYISGVTVYASAVVTRLALSVSERSAEPMIAQPPLPFTRRITRLDLILTSSRLSKTRIACPPRSRSPLLASALRSQLASPWPDVSLQPV